VADRYGFSLLALTTLRASNRLHGEDLVHPYRNVPTPVTTQADERETSQPDTLTARALANLLWALPLLRFLVRRRDGLDDIARIADIGERRDNLVATELTRWPTTPRQP